MSFTKFTLANIRASVGRKLDDPSFDVATIDEAANDFQFELFNDNRIRFMEKNVQLEVLANATSKDLPTDFMTLINLIVAGRNITKTGYISYDDFMQNNPSYATVSPQSINEWTFFGEGIRFAGPVDVSSTLSVDYMRSPAVMTLATDTCELPINCRELMTLGTLVRVMEINEDFNEANDQRDKLDSLRTAFIRNYGRGWEKTGGVVIKTNRGKSGGWNAGDF